MYEMEGALPGHAVPSQPVAWPPRPRGPPAGAVYPRPIPVSRSRPGPLSCLREWCPFPTVKVFLLRRRMPRKGFRQSYGEFFAIHTLSTERGRLSAVSEGLSTGLCTTLPQITSGNPQNTPDMHSGLVLVTGRRAVRSPAPGWPAGAAEAGGRLGPSPEAFQRAR